MSINTNLNISPYFDDFDEQNQFYKVMFTPGRAVQARELTQIQTILQDQIEKFGKNIYQEGTIIKGCSITFIDDLKFVKVKDKVNFDVTSFIGSTSGDTQIFYELEGQTSGLRAQIVSAARGFETRSPNLNTFFFRYLNSGSANQKRFIAGESLVITKKTYLNGAIVAEESGEVDSIEVTQNSSETLDSNGNSLSHEGDSFGVTFSEGVIFQRGFFLFTNEQTIVVSKYNKIPSGISVGYNVDEKIVTFLQDSSLFDNAKGFPNENAPGADRLLLAPQLSILETAAAKADPKFFSIIDFLDGVPIQIRDVSQFNSIAKELAKRTYEESGDYVVKGFEPRIIERNSSAAISLSPGVAYIQGFRIENIAEKIIELDPVSNTAFEEITGQAISVEYGKSFPVTAASGNITLGTTFPRVSLRNSSNTALGSAIVKNYSSDKIHLFDIRMNNANTSFSDVSRVIGTSGIITIDNVLQENNINPTLIFDIGATNIKEVTDIDIVVKDVTSGVTINGSNQFTLTAGAGENFNCDLTNTLIVDNTNTVIPVVSIVKSEPTFGSVLFTTGAGFSNPVTVYHNIRLLGVEPNFKTSETIFVKHTYNNAVSKYSLGIPDVYEIISITDSANVDVTDSFTLNKNQKDNYYDLSFIQRVQNTVNPAEGLFTVEMKAFRRLTDTGIPFYTIDSYSDVPISDVPIYESSNGKIFNLRNCFDFRYTRTPTVSYAYSAGAAPTVSNDVNATPVFANSGFLTPETGSQIFADIKYYSNRIDLLTLDVNGSFTFVKGRETANPVPPNPQNNFVIAEIFIPGGDILLSPEQAVRIGNQAYTPRVISNPVRNYTMEDIQKIDENLNRLTYYTSLNLLEKATMDLRILDGSGLDRFKNGILVDPFVDFSIADVQNSEFDSGLDTSRNELTPSVQSFHMKTKISGNSNIETHPEGVTTLERTSSTKVLIRQPSATNVRTCTSNVYSYKNNGMIYPEYSSDYDTITTPKRINIDLVKPFVDFTNKLQKFIPLTSTTKTTNTKITNSTSTLGNGATRNVEIKNELTRELTRSLQIDNSKIANQKVGNFVSNFQFLPYMKSKMLRVLFTGLRPNTIHYPFFDKIPVTVHTKPGKIKVGTDINKPLNIVSTGVFGAQIKTDARGRAYCIFKIPENTFLVGERIFELMDIDTYANKESAASSIGFVSYNAYNFSVEKTNLTISTRTPKFSVQRDLTQNSVTTRQVTVTQPPVIVRDPSDFGGGNASSDGSPSGGDNCPIAQTFFVKSQQGVNTGCVFIDKLHLFFKRKSAINGISVMIREVINGYPAWNILPFGLVHLEPEEVNISNNASVSTEIVFDAPVRLETEKEYCFVVKPDANDPEYLIFTRKAGGTDLTTNTIVSSDWGDGVLFTSTNNRAWESYQDEDIKFTIYQSVFATESGYVDLELNDPEFLTLSSVIGRFIPDEIVYVELETSANATVSSETTITGTSLSTHYSIGDTVKIESGSNQEVIRVVGVTANTITLDEPSLLSGSVSITKIVSGKISHYEIENSTKIFLEESSAKTGKIFSSNTVIVGLESGAEATIESVDNIELSYIQPMINYTLDTQSKLFLTGLFTDENDVEYTQNLSLEDSNYLNRRRVFVRSKSNNIVSPKQFKLRYNLIGLSDKTSPFIDIDTGSILINRYNIENTAYVSKIVDLSEGFDAEDFKLFLTAYKPINTSIKVYLRPQSYYDPENFEDGDWIELVSRSHNYITSSTTNFDDLREFEFTVPDDSMVDSVLTYTNDFGTFEGYRKFAVKIELIADTRSVVPRVSEYRGIALT